MPFIQDQNKIRKDFQRKKKVPPLVVKTLRSQTVKGFIFVLIFAILVPVLIYYFIVDKGSYYVDEGHTCLIDPNYRIKCGKSNATLEYCYKINCCFDNSTKNCFHYLPSKYYYKNDVAAQDLTPYQRNMTKTISLSINEINANIMQVILHHSSTTVPSQQINDKKYNWKKFEDPLSIEVYRNETNDILLTTADGPLIISENYWEWSFQLTDEYLFGLGQVLIKLDENSTYTKVIYGNSQDHSTQPIFMAYKQGKYHGLLIRHNGPLEITVLPSNIVSLKSLAGDTLILELTIGPTVRDVMKQQKDVINDVKLWMLGVHICREGPLFLSKSIINEYNSDKLDFKYSSDCLHDNLIPTLLNEKDQDNIDSLINLVHDIENNVGQFMLSLPPEVIFNSLLYNETKNLGIYYKKGNKDYIGKYLKNSVVYPYFDHKSISSYLKTLLNKIETYFGNIPTNIILNANWPTDESFQMENSKIFQYLSKDIIDGMSLTLPWYVQSDNRQHIIDHISYGSSQKKTLENYLKQMKIDDTFIAVASHNFDTSGPIIVQNVDISWKNFRNSIITLLYNSIFGYPLTSVPVCGSTSNYSKSIHESLCMRWYLMASTSPLFRLSSSVPRRDPNALNSKTATNTAKFAIETRYQLRYYFYTILNKNEPLMRPMFYDFENDNNTFALVDQYMVGESLMVAHPTLPDKTQLLIYLPTSVKVWYEFWGGQPYDTSNQEWVTLPIVETDFIAFMPHGSIIPLVQENENTLEIKLVVALREKSRQFDATGTLFVGSDIFTFTSSDTQLKITRKSVADVKEVIETIFILTEIKIFQNNKDVPNFITGLETNLTNVDNETIIKYI